MRVVYSLLGIALILALAFALSSNRRAIRPRVVASAFALQAGFAAIVLYVPWGNAALQGAARLLECMLGVDGIVVLTSDHGEQLGDHWLV